MHLGKIITVKEQNPIDCNAPSWCAAIARQSPTKTMRSPAPAAKAIALAAQYAPAIANQFFAEGG